MCAMLAIAEKTRAPERTLINRNKERNNNEESSNEQRP